MPEINDAEYAELKQAHTLLKSLYADSSVGFDFRKLVKKKYPDASMPELEAVVKTEQLGGELVKKVDELGIGLNKKIDEFFAQREKEREESRVADFANRVNKVVKDRGYTKEGEAKLLELMKTEGINDPQNAAIIFESRQPKLERKKREFSSRMAFVSPEGKEDAAFEKLMSDPDQFMMDEMLTVLNNGAEEE